MSAPWDWDQDRRDALEDARQHPEMDTRDIPTLAECEQDEREARRDARVAEGGPPGATVGAFDAPQWEQVGEFDVDGIRVAIERPLGSRRRRVVLRPDFELDDEQELRAVEAADALSWRVCP